MILDPQRISQTLSILPVLANGRFLAAIGKQDLALARLSNFINSPKWKSLAFNNYQPSANDIFIAAYAKSGTNWMMQITQQLAYNGEAEFSHIHDLIPWPDAPFPEVRARLNDPTISQHSPSRLRIIKTHFDRSYVPTNDQARYIVVIRDPKEIIVSGYYFADAVLDPLGVDYTLDEWLTHALGSNPFLFGDWAVHTASWWEVRNEPNIWLLTYKDLKNDPAGIIQKAAEFMSVDLTLAQMEQTKEKSSFEWMKAHETRFSPPMLPKLFNKKRPLMMRSGKSGNSGELLSREQQAAVDEHFYARLKELCSDFPYQENFQL
jgi:hypothetical protein